MLTIQNQHYLNAGEAAQAIHVSRDTFRRLVALYGLTPRQFVGRKGTFYLQAAVMLLENTCEDEREATRAKIAEVQR